MMTACERKGQFGLNDIQLTYVLMVCLAVSSFMLVINSDIFSTIVSIICATLLYDCLNESETSKDIENKKGVFALLILSFVSYFFMMLVFFETSNDVKLSHGSFIIAGFVSIFSTLTIFFLFKHLIIKKYDQD